MRLRILVGAATVVVALHAGFPVGAEAAEILPCTITGTDGNDLLKGKWGNDVICGLGGNDTIYAWGGDDVVYGGDGDDFIHGEQGNDELWGGAGNDYIVGGQWADVIHGEGGNDEMWGDGSPVGGVNSDTYNFGIDTIYGEAGNDRLAGGTHRDGLHGGDGNDTFHSDIDGNFFGNGGDDTIDVCPWASLNNDGMIGSTGGRMFVNGGPGNDTGLGIPSNFWWQKVGTIENFVPCL